MDGDVQIEESGDSEIESLEVTFEKKDECHREYLENEMIAIKSSN